MNSGTAHSRRSALVGDFSSAPFVVIADDWGRHVSTTQHLFRRILPTHDVIWVNSFGHRRPQFTVYDMKRAVAKVARMVVPPRVEPVTETADRPRCVIHPKALPWHNLAWVQQFNAASVGREIRRALRQVAPGRAPVFVTATPLGGDLVGSLGECASIYLCLDDYDQLPGVERNLLVPFEERLLRRVDATVATAAALTESKRPLSGRVLHLPQGVNYGHFSTSRTLPAELAALPRPILGFAGGVGPVIDRSIIHALGAAFPQASIVLVGMHQETIDPAAWPSNVHFLGARPYGELPAYVQGFDVGLVPYVHNQHTRSVDPLKVLEYLAAGIPVVSTGLSEVRKYQEVVYIADGAEAQVAAVAAALRHDDPAQRLRRQAVAAAHTWEQRAGQFLAFIEQVVGDRTPPHR